MKELSLMVKRKRGELGLRTAADQIGITHTTLSRVEAGNLPDLNTFIKICKWLGVQPNEVLGFAGDSAGAPPASLPVAHYRAKKTMGTKTAQHLAELIVKIHGAASSGGL